jgi:hypothetical protein
MPNIIEEIPYNLRGLSPKEITRIIRDFQIEGDTEIVRNLGEVPRRADYKFHADYCRWLRVFYEELRWLGSQEVASIVASALARKAQT